MIGLKGYSISKHCKRLEALAAVMTERHAWILQAVPDIDASFFVVTGPKKSSVSKVRLVAGSQSYYAFSVAVSDGYYGVVNVTMTQVCFVHLTCCRTQ